MSSTYDLIDASSNKELISLSGSTFIALFDMVDNFDGELPTIDFVEEFEYHDHSERIPNPVFFNAITIAENAGNLIRYFNSQSLEDEIGSMAIRHWIDLLRWVKHYAEENPGSTYSSRLFA